MADDAASLYKSVADRVAYDAWRASFAPPPGAHWLWGPHPEDILPKPVPTHVEGVCNRIGCEEPVEAPRRRYCTPHRQEHGRRLGVQLEAAIETIRAKSASAPVAPDGGEGR